ncbi:MAG: T9SS type A sorting domain-containing protein [Bacteroidia bacterium]
MNKKQNKSRDLFLRSLAQYSALGGALIGSVNQAQATIHYNTLSGIPFSDASASVGGLPAGMMLFRDEPGKHSIWLSIGGGLSVFGSTSSYFPNALNAGVTVGPGAGWHVEATQFIAYTNSPGPDGGNFLGVTGKFLAFRFNSGGVKYGWLRLSASSDASSITLVDWAYQDNGGTILTGDTGTPTPIKLLSFEVRSLQNAIALQWETAREENFDGFSLERAEGGGVFTEIAWIPGSGNSTTPRTYHFRDEAIVENKSYYYRLRSVDLDGSYEYSSVVEIVFNNLGFTVKDPYPNPVTEKAFTIEVQSVEAENIQLRLFANDGRLVHEQPAVLRSGLNTISVSIPHLASGIYFLKVQGRYYSSYKSLVVN